MRRSPSSRDCRKAFVDIPAAPSPSSSEVSWKQPYFEARMPGMNGEYLEGEASLKFLPCLPSLLQPYHTSALRPQCDCVIIV
jgi:hypothetical protein